MPTLAHHKTAHFDYEILERFEAGIVLTGAEVKSVKTGHLNLKGSYVVIDKNNDVQLIGCHIAAYPPAAGSPHKHDPTRTKKLLLGKQEAVSLGTKAQSFGLTILPLSVYTKGGLIKVEIALGRGKKKHDKRQSIKKHEVEREMRRKIKDQG